MPLTVGPMQGLTMATWPLKASSSLTRPGFNQTACVFAGSCGDWTHQDHKSLCLHPVVCAVVLKPSADPQLVTCPQFAELDQLPDPCPLPSTVKKRGLNEKERMLYAPMADVGGLMYDKDAVYINIPDWKVGRDASPWSLPDGSKGILCCATYFCGQQLEASRI